MSDGRWRKLVEICREKQQLGEGRLRAASCEGDTIRSMRGSWGMLAGREQQKRAANRDIEAIGCWGKGEF